MRRLRVPGESVAAPAEAAPRPRRATTPRGRLLGNGRFRTLLTRAGTGGAWLDGQALTAWRGDRIEDGDGWFVYLRDLDDGGFWSIAERPVPVAPEGYATDGGPGWLGFERRQAGIVARMDVWVDAALPAECRVVTVRNPGARARRLELTSYLEAVLQDPRHHAAHPGFSKLFVQTEYLPERELLLAWRRPRDPDARHPWLAHGCRGPGALAHESDRGRFIGRGRGMDAPLALRSRDPLTGTTGDVLDPALVLRRTLDLPPGASVQVELTLAAGWDRSEVLATAAGLEAAGALERSRQAAVATAGRRLELLGIDPGDGEAFERLATAMLYGDPALGVAPGSGPGATPPAESLARNGRPGIPLRGPVVVVEAGAPRATEQRARKAAADPHALWLPTTLVILGDGLAAERSPESEPEGVVVVAEPLDAESLARLRARADLLLAGDDPAPAPEPDDADEDRAEARGGAPRLPVAAPPAPAGASPAFLGWDRPLSSFNGWGGFDAGGTEYVIRMPRDVHGAPRLTPRPWINVLANPGFGALISESGAGSTWSRNSRELRLTPWSNDPVCDPHDEALYLGDQDDGRLWSAFPGPIPGDGPYEMRHGFGYSRCRHASAGLELETEVFVHASDPVKVVQVMITNPGPGARRITLASYQRLVLGHAPERAARTVTTWADAGRGILFARAAGAPDYADAVAFAAAVLPGAASVRMGSDRGQVLGPGGSPARPAALLAGRGPDGRTGAGFDPCFCLQAPLEIGPGQSLTAAFLLGEAAAVETIEAMVARLRRPQAIASARDEVVAQWRERLGRVRVETPAATLDPLVNGWLAYQAIACRLWARTAFYQSGGAYGFRDQLQDAAAFAGLEPSITRDQILLHASRQFLEGDVLHWWHPPAGRGIRTRFVDDLLWLPFVTAHYVRTTGDHGVLDERAPFLSAPALAPGQDEVYLLPEVAAETADVYEHCCRAIERSLHTGSHGLPLFGGGDWNDGMNRVGREGRGESVWMAFFLYSVIDDFVPLCERRGDSARAARLRTHQEHLRAAVERAGWDGEWYRRGYYDDGAPLGSRDSDECRIDALVQAWSVVSGAAPHDRAAQAMEAVARKLIAWDEGRVHLLAPPFDRTPRDPGYIKGYLPGVRENGGQYTHAALWVVEALARLGRREEGASLLASMSPVARAATPESAAVYQVEPYVVAADVYANPQHRGRGGWTWYTGSAGWMLRVALEEILGVTLEDGRTLVVRAAIPPGWPGYRMRLRPFGGAGTWHIEVRNPSAAGAGVVGIRVDGRAIAPILGVGRIPLAKDELDHHVEIEIR